MVVEIFFRDIASAHREQKNVETPNITACLKPWRA